MYGSGDKSPGPGGADGGWKTAYPPPQQQPPPPPQSFHQQPQQQQQQHRQPPGYHAQSPPPQSQQQQQQSSANRALLPLQHSQQQQQQQQQQQAALQQAAQQLQVGALNQQQLSALMNLSNLSSHQLNQIMQQLQQQPSPQGAQSPPQLQPPQQQPQQLASHYSPLSGNVQQQQQQHQQPPPPPHLQYTGSSPLHPSHQLPSPAFPKAMAQWRGVDELGGSGGGGGGGGPSPSPPPAQQQQLQQQGPYTRQGPPQMASPQAQQGQGQGSQSPSNDVAQVQQWQQHVLSLMQKKQQHQHHLSSESGGPSPLTRPSSIDERSSVGSASSPYMSPMSSQSTHGLGSPSLSSHRGGAGGGGGGSGYHSNIGSGRAHSRSISGSLGLGSLNPAAAVFDPSFSNPSSPANASIGGGGTAAQSPSARYMAARAASSTPTIGSSGGVGGGGFGGSSSSASPPSTASSSMSQSRSMDGSALLAVQSPSTASSAQQQQPLQQHAAHSASAVSQSQQQFDEQLHALGLPLLPFDKREIDAQIARERPDHASYIYGFRVHVCEEFLQGRCPNDAYTCFQTHARLPRRRKPILQHGRFNYIPTRCRYIIEEKECPQGVHCRFSHVTEEVIYHASKFKTQLCSHPLDKEGRCAGYGAHCAKAHGPLDLRQPVFETDEASSAKMNSQEFFDFVCPPDKRDIERAYFQYVYKTRPCAGFPYSCSCDGLDAHRPEESRRGPIITYMPMACPNVKPYLNAEWARPNIDCSGRFKPKVLNKNGQLVPQESDQWDCEYAHTLLELMYHPQVYKTGLCDHFNEDDPSSWRCVWKRRCAHSHGRDDVRTKEEATEGWRQHLMAALPLTNHAQLPTMLNRLLAAGGAAFDSLASGGSKSRAGSNASPSSAHHRRLSAAQGGSSIGGPMRAGSMNQGPSGRVSHSFQGGAVHGSPHSFAQQQLQQLQQHDTSPHSQPVTPMQHARAPMLLMGASGVQTSPNQESPRSLLGAPALKTALMGSGAVSAGVEPRTTTPLIGLSGGFFSGSESSLWAPSPKAQITPSSAQQQQHHHQQQQQLSQSVPVPTRALERFSFEQREIASASDPAAAWAAAAQLEERAAEKVHASPYLSPHGLHASSSLLAHATQQELLQSASVAALHHDDSKLVSPTPLLQLGSPSPDSLLATNVATRPLWGSPPTDSSLGDGGTSAAALATLQRQLSSHLQCSFTEGAAGAHLLSSSPVVAPCCGAALCKTCTEGFLSQAQARSKAEVPTDEEATEESTTGVCRCGRTLSAADAQRLRDAPVVSALQQLRDLVRPPHEAASAANGHRVSRSSSRSGSHGSMSPQLSSLSVAKSPELLEKKMPA